jgi:hypothetical protein
VLNKKIALTSAATCAAVTAALAGSLVPAASQQPAGETFSFCTQEQSGFDRMIDVGRKSFSPGDYSVGVKPLFDPATGSRKGTLVSTFTFVQPIGKNGGRGYVEGTHELADGKITFYGSFSFSDDDVAFAVTGGTGAYSAVRGTVTDSPGRCRGKKGGRMTYALTRNG